MPKRNFSVLGEDDEIDKEDAGPQFSPDLDDEEKDSDGLEEDDDELEEN